MPTCPQCTRFFYHHDILHCHCRDEPDHPYCSECERLFTTFHALNQVGYFTAISDARNSSNYQLKHLENAPVHRTYSNSNHHSHHAKEQVESTYCSGCNRSFVDRASLFQHLATSSRHNWCFPCSRDFISPNALDQVRIAPEPRDNRKAHNPPAR